ncbi:23S rRNA (adenine(2030)-N(6))-methyltransferase RlmJ, partial [Luteimonas aestuarii]
HADVLKHVVVLAICDALAAKPAPCFALDTHAGRGLYRLDADAARRTGEAEGGIARLLAQPPKAPALRRYLSAVATCRTAHGAQAYPGSPWLLAHALRAQDRIACCELQPDEAKALQRQLGDDARLTVHPRDGYAAIKALLPPRHGAVRYARGLVLIDPPYEAQLGEFDAALSALREGLSRWPQGCFVLWYPIKQGGALRPTMRKAAALPGKSLLRVELTVRPDDSPLRMNGSGLLAWNAPWGLHDALARALPELATRLDEGGGGCTMEWLRAPA